MGEVTFRNKPDYYAASAQDYLYLKWPWRRVCISDKLILNKNTYCVPRIFCQQFKNTI